ncbi:MAG: VOC family protein [Alkalispirochaeta sp.]
MSNLLQEPLPFLSAGVAQVAWVVQDVDAAVRDYHRTFGIDGWAFYTYQKPFVPRMTYRGQDADYAMRVALAYFGPMRVEFIQPLRGPSIYHEFVDRHGYGVQHLGVLVTDMEAALADARDMGIEMVQDGAGFGLDGDGHYAYLDTEARFGVTFELIERPARRQPPDKVYPAETEGELQQ